MEILKKFGINSDNPIYETAMAHTSYANENKTESYERLEFLGDAVLELLMSEYLYKKEKYKEGEMTKLRAHFVCEEALYEYSVRLGLDKYVKLGKGEREHGGKQNKAILSDIFESFLGAIFLDKGIFEAKKFWDTYVVPIIESGEISYFKDYKSELQEYVQTDKKSLEYIIVSETGPAHNKTFTVEVRIDGIVYGTGTAGSKKNAEQEAAKNAIEKAQRG
jgi:ribonuclease-3